jgi:hypothetical protein
MPTTVTTPDDLNPINAAVAALQAQANANSLAITNLTTLGNIQDARLIDAEARLAALESATPPPPPPVTRTLLGGWRLRQGYARGGIAIDFNSMRVGMIGHAQRNEVVEFDLPEMGVGDDPAAWPQVNKSAVVPGWWARGYGNDIEYRDGKRWVAPRIFYAIGANVHPDLILYAEDGEQYRVDAEGPGDQQKYAGLCRGRPDVLTAGGYESGQGTSSGANIIDRATGLIRQKYEWPASPGANLEFWNLRAPRPANYWPVNNTDSWVAWNPREIDGTIQGRWACDRIFGGSYADLNGDIVFHCWLGVGDINYSRQNETFAASNETWEYRYDGSTYELKSYSHRPDLGKIVGRELGPDGRLYLCEADVWKSGTEWNCAIKVYG